MARNVFGDIFGTKINEEAGRDEIEQNARYCQIHHSNIILHCDFDIYVVYSVEDAVKVDEHDGFAFV